MQTHPLRRETIFACIVGLAIYVAGTVEHGLSVAPDSVQYLAAAQSLASDRIFAGYDAAPYVSWPPLYPTLLATMVVLGFSAIVGAWILNGAALVGIIVGGSILYREHLNSRALAVSATVLLAMSYPLHFVVAKAWSEPVFILLALWSVVAMTRYVRIPDVRWLVLASVLTSLAMLQRTAGVSLAATGLLTIVFVASAPSMRSRLVRAASFSLVTAVPTLAWAARNLAVSGTASGERGTSAYSAGENILLMVRTLAGWFIPGRLLGASTVVLMALLALGVLGVLWLVRVRGPVLQWINLRALLPAIVFVGAYLVVSLVASGLVNLDPLDDRLLSPVFPFVLLFLFIGIEHASSWLAQVLKRPALVGSVVTATILLIFAKPIVQTARSVTGRLTDVHHNFQSARWADSAVLEHLRQTSTQALLFSNRPDAIYFQTGINASLSPMKTLYNSSDTPSADVTERLDDEIAASGKAYLVWFDRSQRRILYHLDELEAMYLLEVVAGLDDGVVLTVEPLHE